MKKKKIVVMRSCIASLSCLYLMICSSCGNPRNGESKNEDNTKEIEIVKKEPITYNFYVENSGSVKGYFKGNTNDAGNILKEFYNPQIEMFARFKMKSSFHKTKRII